MALVTRKCQKTDSLFREMQNIEKLIPWGGIPLEVAGSSFGGSGLMGADSAGAGGGFKVSRRLSEADALILLDPLRGEFRSRVRGWLPARPQNFRKD